MDVCKTIRVKPWGKDQGEFVEINAEDFDPKIHKPFEAGAGAAPSAPRLDPAEAQVERIQGEQVYDPRPPRKAPPKRKRKGK